MSRTSPTKEEAIRLTKLFEYAMKHQFVEVFGAEPTMAQVAEKLGYPEERLRSILNGNAYRASIEKVARAVTAWVKDGSLNADYVIVGGKAKMLKKPKKTEEPAPVEDKPAEDVLPTVDMDDELDDMAVAEAVVTDDDEELTELPEIADDDSNDDLVALDPAPFPDIPDTPETSLEEQAAAKIKEIDVFEEERKIADVVQDAIQCAANSIAAEDKSKKTFAPKTAKDYWIDAAIDLGISADALNDHFMQLFSTRDGRLHLFKEPEGKLPYRQEIYEVQAVGLGKPSVISYYDDKVMYRIRYAVVHKGEIVIEAASEKDANSMLFDKFAKNKFYIGGKEMTFDHLCTDIDAVRED